jgi:hypothetical protein
VLRMGRVRNQWRNIARECNHATVWLLCIKRD